MSWRIFSRSFALADGGFHLMALNGSGPVLTWESRMRSAVTICRFPREHTPRGSSIAARIVVRSFRESAAQSLVSPAAANTTAANSICGFGSSTSACVSLLCGANTLRPAVSQSDWLGLFAIPSYVTMTLSGFGVYCVMPVICQLPPRRSTMNCNAPAASAAP